MLNARDAVSYGSTDAQHAAVSHGIGSTLSDSILYNIFRSFENMNVLEEYRSRYKSHQYTVVVEITRATAEDKRYLFGAFGVEPEKRIWFAQNGEVSKEMMLVVGIGRYVKPDGYSISVKEGVLAEEVFSDSDNPVMVYNIGFHSSWKLTSIENCKVSLSYVNHGIEDPRDFIRTFISTGISYHLPYYEVSVPKTYENLVSMMFSHELISKGEYNPVLVRYLQYYRVLLQGYVYRTAYGVIVNHDFVYTPQGERFAADLLLNYRDFEYAAKVYLSSRTNRMYRDLFLFCDSACNIVRRAVTRIPEDVTKGAAFDALCMIYAFTCHDRQFFADNVGERERFFLESMIIFNRNYRTVSAVKAYMHIVSAGKYGHMSAIIPELMPELLETVRIIIDIFAVVEGEDIVRLYRDGNRVVQEVIGAMSVSTMDRKLLLKKTLKRVSSYKNMLDKYELRRDFVKSGFALDENNSEVMFNDIKNGRGDITVLVVHAIVYEIEQMCLRYKISTPDSMLSKGVIEELTQLCNDLLLAVNVQERHASDRGLFNDVIKKEINAYCAPKMERFIKVAGKRNVEMSWGEKFYMYEKIRLRERDSRRASKKKSDRLALDFELSESSSSVKKSTQEKSTQVEPVVLDFELLQSSLSLRERIMRENDVLEPVALDSEPLQSSSSPVRKSTKEEKSDVVEPVVLDLEPLQSSSSVKKGTQEEKSDVVEPVMLDFELLQSSLSQKKSTQEENSDLIEAVVLDFIFSQSSSPVKKSTRVEAVALDLEPSQSSSPQKKSIQEIKSDLVKPAVLDLEPLQSSSSVKKSTQEIKSDLVKAAVLDSKPSQSSSPVKKSTQEEKSDLIEPVALDLEPSQSSSSPVRKSTQEEKMSDLIEAAVLDLEPSQSSLLLRKSIQGRKSDLIEPVALDLEPSQSSSSVKKSTQGKKSDVVKPAVLDSKPSQSSSSPVRKSTQEEKMSDLIEAAVLDLEPSQSSLPLRKSIQGRKSDLIEPIAMEDKVGTMLEDLEIEEGYFYVELP